nr:MAG TPA: hypothetical protein [Caudoviricetes sp.]
MIDILIFSIAAVSITIAKPTTENNGCYLTSNITI